MSLLTQVLAPAVCDGCGRAGTTWCATCAGTPSQPGWVDVGVPVLSVFRFDGPVRRTIIDWKERGSATAGARVGAWLYPGIDAFVRAYGAITCVPIPSAPAAQRYRGAWPLLDVLRALDVAVAPWLHSCRDRHDQAGLDRAARSENLRGAMQWIGPVCAPVLLVDDVVTSGATMREAVRAARVAGAPVLAGIALARRERGDPVAQWAVGLS